MISILATCTRNGGISYEGNTLWELEEVDRLLGKMVADMTVIMGRKLYERRGPLEKSVNAIITRQKGYRDDDIVVLGSVKESEDMVAMSGEETFVIGGAETFSSFMPIATKVYLIIVHGDYPCDTILPKFDPYMWSIGKMARHNSESHTLVELLRNHERRIPSVRLAR